VARSPDYQRDGITLYCGDCLEILPEIGAVDAVITDPPYGVSNDCDYTRFTGGQRKNATLPQGRVHQAIEGDDKPFDPAPWLDFPHVVLWGANNFSERLPQGAWFVWDKKNEGLEGKFMSDCEVAWRKGGVGVFMFRHVWDGFNRATERGEHHHPSQKPVALMEWCIERHPKANVILDPYMGSGTTGVACVRLGKQFVGIEKEDAHFATAVKRIDAALDTDRDSLWTAKQLAEQQRPLFE